MAIEWLTLVKELPGLIKDLGGLITSSNATKKLLLSELKLNLKQFDNARKTDTSYDNLIDILSNEIIADARRKGFVFKTIKLGKVEDKHIKDDRNKKYKGKDCEWLFINIDDKIKELKDLKKLRKTYEGNLKLNIPLQFSNLFYKMKLLTDFINS